MTAYPIDALFFDSPDDWDSTRSVIDYFCYYDHLFDKNFTDTELDSIFTLLDGWNLDLALEVAVLKDFIRTGADGFAYGDSMWTRFEGDCGASITLFAMDEPYWAVVSEGIGTGDLAYSVAQTAIWMDSVRTNYPDAEIVSIEPYPVLDEAELEEWIESLEAECQELSIDGIDAFSLDPDWEHRSFDWDSVAALESFCDSEGIPFSLIYWAADATDSTSSDYDWYAGIMDQGEAYSGSPDEYVVESWVWVPRVMTPDTASGNAYPFTRSVLDFYNEFIDWRWP